MGGNKQIDPELLRQLDDVATNDEPVEAVVRLRPDRPAEIVPSPERTKQLAEQILQRVGKRVGISPARHNVFSNMGSLVVSAPTRFVRELIAQPEVAAAVANRQAGDALIPPIDKKPVAEKKPRSKTAAKVRPSSTKRPAKATSRKQSNRSRKTR